MTPSTRLRLLESAERLLAEGGALTPASVAAGAGVAESVAALAFPTADDVALALYGELASSLSSWSAHMPDGTVADRFRAVLERKLALLATKRAVWSALVRTVLDENSRARVNAPEARRVRDAVLSVFDVAVRGATDAPSPAHAARLARHLYTAHLGVVLAWSLQPAAVDGVDSVVDDIVTVATRAASTLRRAAPVLYRLDAVRRLDRALERTLFATAAVDGADAVAQKVLDLIGKHARLLDVDGARRAGTLDLHRGTVRAFVEENAPIELVLPAFPAKAPNLQKVLGVLPDAAERLAVAFLARLLDEIAAVHPPGARLVIASDGHVFADAVGVADAAVDAYRNALAAMLPAGIEIFTLGDAFPGADDDERRRALLERHADSAAEIRARAKASASARAQLDGIHRFLFEDELARVQAQPSPPSKSQIRAAMRERAVEVVRRSEAWGRLVAAAFPRALRLSIHPQPPLSTKIGIHLLPTHDAWLTPWHGAAVFKDGAFSLMKRADAEALGAVVVDEDGRPSHLEVRA